MDWTAKKSKDITSFRCYEQKGWAALFPRSVGCGPVVGVPGGDAPLSDPDLGTSGFGIDRFSPTAVVRLGTVEG